MPLRWVCPLQLVTDPTFPGVIYLLSPTLFLAGGVKLGLLRLLGIPGSPCILDPSSLVSGSTSKPAFCVTPLPWQSPSSGYHSHKRQYSFLRILATK